MTRQRTLFVDEPSDWELDQSSDRQIATVVFPDAPVGEFDYEVPDPFRARLQVGARIWVPLGRGNTARVGYCVALRVDPTNQRKLKLVRGIMDDPSLISADVLALAHWMADHYLCELGAALETVVPSGVRSQAGTREQKYFQVVPQDGTDENSARLPAKQAAVLSYLTATGKPQTAGQIAQHVGCTMAPIQALVRKKKIMTCSRRVLSHTVPATSFDRDTAPVLNADQQGAYDAIRVSLGTGAHETILLFGVTGSGKTEVYIRAIEEVVRYGRQAIVLVPEISLTPQTCQRFQSRLASVAVLHSHLRDAQRHTEWQRIARDEVDVVVGARSAVFAPVRRLGLIVIDEEHETSFKQDTSPRYHARDVARRRAEMAGVPLVLGSATPSLESWLQSQRPRARMIPLPQRVNRLPLPRVAIVDLRTEMQSRVAPTVISRPLHHAMRETIRDGGQVILLLNRRGYSSHIQCPRCGFVARCVNCDVALTHHRDRELAKCHYCDYQIPTPPQCPECEFGGVRFSGMGTQRLESQVRRMFPEVTCLRMDTDTMKRPGSHEHALNRFRAGEVQVLLGTQMIAKGLDFPNVTLVGVINADLALHLQDFRSLERTFQLVTQVAGRTGRGPKGGRVLVQTFSPDLPVIRAAARHDYLEFARQELPRRQAMRYPPYSTLIRVVARGPRPIELRDFTEMVAARIRDRCTAADFPFRMMGPTIPQIDRLRGNHRRHLFLLSEQADTLRNCVREATGQLQPPDGVQYIVDVDAQSLI